jgi:hypothetical protein
MASAILADIISCNQLRIEAALEEDLGMSLNPEESGSHPSEQAPLATAATAD